MSQRAALDRINCKDHEEAGRSRHRFDRWMQGKTGRKRTVGFILASLYCRHFRRARVLHKFNMDRSGALRPASRAIIWRLEKPTYGLQTRFNTTRGLIRFSADIESSSISRRLRRRSGRQFGMILTIIDRHLVGFRSRSIDIVDGNRRKIANRSNWEDHARSGWRKRALPQPSPEWM